MTPLAITGMGIVSRAGTGKEAFFEALARGVPCAPLAKNEIVSFDASAYEAPNVVEVKDFDPTKTLGDKGLRTLDRVTKLLIVAARICLQDARIKNEGQFIASAPEKAGFVCSNAYGSLEAITELDRVALLEDARYINPAKFPNTVSNSAAGYVSIWEDLRALNVSVSNGNTGALDAFGIAELHLAEDRADVLVTGGGEAMCEALFLAFRKLGALANACLGEGAALFCVETDDVANARGASVVGHVTGYGTHFSPPNDDGALLYASSEALVVASNTALADAGATAQDIDAVVCGISGIRPFDRAEAAAIAEVCGARVAVAAPKKIFGETLGAGGGLGLGAALFALAGGTLAPLESGKLGAAPKTVLVTSLGYYGNASAIVVTR